MTSEIVISVERQQSSRSLSFRWASGFFSALIVSRYFFYDYTVLNLVSIRIARCKFMFSMSLFYLPYTHSISVIIYNILVTCPCVIAATIN